MVNLEAPVSIGASTRALRVLIVALNYAPDLVGCAKYTTELAEALVARGHLVEVVTAPPYYPNWVIGDGYSGARWSKEALGGVIVHRAPLYVPGRPSGLKRLLHLASFGLSALPTAIAVARRFRPDLVFSVAPALTSTGAALAAAASARAASWLHVQDFEVDAAFDLGLLKGPLARRIALGFERLIFGGFDRVSSISPAMVRLLGDKGVERAIELRNWVDVDTTRVFPSSNTDFRRTLGIDPAQIVALYSGNMAGKQGLEALAEVAVQLKKANAPVTLLLCGAGPGRADLEASCVGLDNVRFLPLQPLDRLPELLGTADIHLLPQRPEAADLVLPSKLAGMLASGRPVVAMAMPGTALASEVEGCGMVVQPDADSMAAAILTLASDDDLRRKLGLVARERAETRWRKSAIIDAFEIEIKDLTAKPSGKIA